MVVAAVQTEVQNMPPVGQATAHQAFAVKQAKEVDLPLGDAAVPILGLGKGAHTGTPARTGLQGGFLFLKGTPK